MMMMLMMMMTMLMMMMLMMVMMMMSYVATSRDCKASHPEVSREIPNNWPVMIFKQGTCVNPDVLTSTQAY